MSDVVMEAMSAMAGDPAFAKASARQTSERSGLSLSNTARRASTARHKPQWRTPSSAVAHRAMAGQVGEQGAAMLRPSSLFPRGRTPGFKLRLAVPEGRN